jgi:hypothetical protein
MTIEIFPTLHFLARPGLTPSLLAFTRSGSATRMGPRGLVEAVAADVLRHDYDPASGVYLGWLVEESRTNLALHGRDQSVAPWTRSNMTAARTALGLDGGTASATTLTATLAAMPHPCRNSTSPSPPAFQPGSTPLLLRRRSTPLLRPPRQVPFANAILIMPDNCSMNCRS